LDLRQQHFSLFLFPSSFSVEEISRKQGKRKKEKYAPPSPADRPNFFKLRIADKKFVWLPNNCKIWVQDSLN
jgi:hypothetical protein